MPDVHQPDLFIETDPTAALRLITGRQTGVHARVVHAVADLLREEEAKDAFTTPAQIDTLAYALVRVMEAFFYNDTAVGLEPRLDEAHAIFSLLLGIEPDTRVSDLAWSRPPESVEVPCRIPGRDTWMLPAHAGVIPPTSCTPGASACAPRARGGTKRRGRCVYGV